MASPGGLRYPRGPGPRPLTAAPQQDLQLQRRLQQDSIELAGKVVYLNPFLYWRRFDANTDRWLREPGQLPEDQILPNRQRFYPELAWDLLSDDERQIKDGAVEMFLKSLDLISTFNPELTPGQLLEVERKMAVTKKRAFERWVSRSLKRRQQQLDSERLEREREVIAELTGPEGVVLATGGGAVLDPRNRERLAATGTVVYLETSLDALVERTRSAKTRPLLMNGDPRAVLESLMTVRKPLYEEVADLKIETTGRTVRAVAADIRERLAAAS